MSLSGIVSLFAGSVRAQCAGGAFERFLQCALEAGIEPSCIKKSDGVGLFTVGAREYHKLRHSARLCQCHMRAIEKRGLPFAVRRIKCRGPLALGLIVMLLSVFVLGNLVVTIDICGSSTIPRATIIESLSRAGLSVGMWQGKTDVELVEQLVLLENERLSWIAINLSFGKASVELRDKLKKSNDVVNPLGGSIIATRDAQVRKVKLVGGTALVKPGDVVRAGQTLVNQSELSGAGSWAREAEAAITGRTVYKETFEIEKTQILRERTGRVKRVSSLSFCDFTLPKISASCDFTYFDVLEYRRPLIIFSAELPVRICTTEYTEVVQRTRKLNELQAQILFDERIDKYEKEKFRSSKVLSRELTVSDDGSKYRLIAEYMCDEEIGQYICP
ncbi:MAG: sporulation protein YqfD [Oscillospiraceae bacterium]